MVVDVAESSLASTRHHAPAKLKSVNRQYQSS
jgi:hypothetical protein